MKLGSIISRCTVALVDAKKKMQSLQIRLVSGHPKDAVEHMEPYGFTSHPIGGAEGVMVCPGGDVSHSIVILVSDRRFRMRELEQGEVAIFDDLGQSVHLTRSGIVVKGSGNPITLTDTPLVKIEANLLVDGDIESKKDIKAIGNITDNTGEAGKSMAAMRALYDSHDHPETGTTTGKPNQKA